MLPSTLSILTNAFPHEERARAIGVWAGVSAIGLALGPILGGWLLEHFSWGSVFLINVPIVVVALVAGQLHSPEQQGPKRAAPRSRGRRIVGRRDCWRWSSASSRCRRVAGGPARSSPPSLSRRSSWRPFVAWEIRCDHPMLESELLPQPELLGGEPDDDADVLRPVVGAVLRNAVLPVHPGLFAVADRGSGFCRWS